MRLAGRASSPEVARATLRALKTVAEADDEFHALERTLLNAVQEHVLQTEFDVDSLSALTPSEAARLIQDPDERRRLLCAAVLMALIDTQADPRELALVEAYADAFQLDDQSVTQLRHFAQGATQRIRSNLLRRFIATDRVGLEFRRRGLRGLAQLARRQLVREDVTRAGRYRGLEYQREGTLGREFFRFMRARDFAMPGERGSLPEFSVFHDCNHVLAGYDSDPAGEAQMSAFHAGYRQQDQMSMLMLAVMQFHLGVQILPLSDGMVGQIDPAALFAAFARGSAVNQDLTRTWDPEDDFDVDCDELRARFHIIPLV